MVYLYFPRQSGYSDSRTILANGMTVTRLDEGGYYPFLAAPGRMTFSLSGVPEERNLTVTVEPGRTYFVKIVFVEQGMSLRFRSVVYQLFPVHEELAHAEMGPLRLMTTCHSTEGCVPIRK